ncbi:MAG: hypothetical protein Tsb0020_40230 [Haliangiales bacterium]
MARFISVGQQADGVIAIGQIATGVIAIGQVATGVIAIGQVARGVFAVGMGALGLFAIGMGAVGVVWGSGFGIGGRSGYGLVLPLFWLPRAGSRGLGRWLRVLGQLALLAVASVVFWLVAGLPLGDALLGPGGILR